MKKYKSEIENPKSEISRGKGRGLQNAYPLNNRFGAGGYPYEIKTAG
jgi:hypothetical protein